jgi:hypothetical protein
MSVEDQIAGILTIISAQNEQIKANSEQIIANGEQIKSNSDLIKANGEQIKVLTENMEFMEHVQYDFHLQMVTYQRDMRALRRDTLNLLKTLQQNRIL